MKHTIYTCRRRQVDVSLYDFFIAANLDWNNQDTNLLAEPWEIRDIFDIREYKG